jgi:diaminohydroxyphosphoribosylaminopyrimidine deaminase/5-amino-6-(5-phosphoribosylamino)uracil reductase
MPIRVILDTNARLDPNAKLTETAREVPVWLMVQREAPAERIAALEEAGVVVLRQGEGSGGVDMNAVMTTLGERGITRLLVEGGSRVAATLISMGLADEVILFRAPVVVGPEGVRALAGHAMSAIERSPRYQLVDDALIGEDRLRRYLRVN